MNDKIVFSHRPKSGVSVGALSTGDRLFVAIALTNDGWSLNHKFHEDRKDSFSRSRSRSIIAGRIKNAQENPQSCEFTFSFQTNVKAADFMHAFREWFKPSHEEKDNNFALVEEQSGTIVLERIGGKEIADRIYFKIFETLQKLDGAHV